VQELRGCRLEALPLLCVLQKARNVSGHFQLPRVQKRGRNADLIVRDLQPEDIADDVVVLERYFCRTSLLVLKSKHEILLLSVEEASAEILIVVAVD